MPKSLASLRLNYSYHDGTTALRHEHSGPLRVLKSLYPEGAAVCHNVMIHPPSGLVGGDELDVQIQLQEGAHALITTPGAARFFASKLLTATQRTRAQLAPHSKLEWFPMESLAYNDCLGSFLERADNTARLLDVKSLTAENMKAFHQDSVDDFYYWAAILRSVSAFEIYRKAYRDVITPERVAELLILRPDMPRSLVACVAEVANLLAQVKNSQSSTTLTQTRNILAELRDESIEEVLEMGLHHYLKLFLEKINLVGLGISHDFLLLTDDVPA